MDVKRRLGSVQVVALTATPPYDVPPQEWRRYQRMCGPIDAEVSVPELVRERNLCPHQDYVYFSHPSEAECARIHEFRSGVRQFVEELVRNEPFIEAIRTHPWLRDPAGHAEAILSRPSYLSSMLVFLDAAGVPVPRSALEVLGLPRKRLPPLDLEWLEILLTGCFYQDADSYAQQAALMDDLCRSLKRLGAVERRKVMLRSTRTITRLLRSSITKLDSICRIVDLEREALGDALRLVILTDFVRRADLPRGPDDLRPLNRIGVATIFEKLRREGHGGVRLGVLSGSLVIVPAASVGRLREIGTTMGIEADRIRCTPLRHDAGYTSVEIQGAGRQRIVRLVTRLFSEGGITCLVGTKALLGEGWDAPSINALVLASFVGSYMLSNQMRGRAIRTQPGNPQKTANIWHPVCVEEGPEGPGHDFAMLSRRFRAFVGVSFTEPTIENGVERLGLGAEPFTRGRVEAINEGMAGRALDRPGLRAAWDEALHRGEEGFRFVREIRTAPVLLPRGFVFANTILALAWRGLLLGGYVITHHMGTALRAAQVHESLGALLFAAAWLCLIGAAASLPWLVKALWLFVRHGPIASSMRQVGRALLDTLTEIDAISTGRTQLRVRCEKGEHGEVSCSLEGGTAYEKSVYLDALVELLNPVANPRYLIVRRTPLLGRFGREDYLVVPQVVGRKKESAEVLLRNWKRRVGPADLVYTRTAEGRRLLLKARGHALSAAFRPRSERISCWK